MGRGWRDERGCGRGVRALALGRAGALCDTLEVEAFRTLRPVLTPTAVAHGFADVLPEHSITPARGFFGNGRDERAWPRGTYLIAANATPLQEDGADTIPNAGSGVGSPAEALELAPETLAGPALPTHGHDLWPGLRHDRRAVVHVTGRGDEGSDTRVDRPHDLDNALPIRDEGLHPIAGANLR
jgi:hypothetical protein